MGPRLSEVREMFTGIVTDVGTVRALRPAGAAADLRLEIATAYDTQTIAIGASIACAGCCLTVVATGADWFAVEASRETLAKTTLGGWRTGRRINLERALRLGDELGGHLVSGHVDARARVAESAPVGPSLRVAFDLPRALGRFLASKGSVAVDGVSLTVNEVCDRDRETTRFTVNLIAHTQRVTTLGALAVGDEANLEVDTLARYVVRLQESER
jgi:riboflavin synthase